MVQFWKKQYSTLKHQSVPLTQSPLLFFKSVLNSLKADLLQVVNASFSSGSFPKSRKTAVVKLLVKKSIEQLKTDLKSSFYRQDH